MAAVMGGSLRDVHVTGTWSPSILELKGSCCSLMNDDIVRTDRRGLALLMVFTFFMVIGFEMIMPLVVGQFVTVRGFSATAVAAALAVRRFMQQGLALLGGALADRRNVRGLICVGVLLRAAGFMMLAYGDCYWILLVSMILIGLGGVLFEMPYQTAIATLTTDEDRPRYYSLNSTVIGIASTLGPLLGALLLKMDFMAVCFGAAACFIVNFFVSVSALPNIQRRGVSYSVPRSVRTVFSSKGFLVFVGLMTVFWLSASQIDISYPLRIQELTGTLESVGAMYAIYAAITAVLQYPLVSFLLKRLEPVDIVLVGIAFIVVSLLVAGFAETGFMFFISVVLFAVGMLLARPNQQTIAVALADKRALGMFLGFNSLSTAVGCGIGTIFGGICFDFAATIGDAHITWYVFALVAFIALIGFSLVKSMGKRNIGVSR